MKLFCGKIGFCLGVEKAFDKAIEARQKKKIIYSYGRLIHNNKVVETLKALGIIPIEDITKLSKSDILLISAHGVGRSVYEYLDGKEIKYIDATCPMVKRIHESVEEYALDGYHIVVIGDENHTEVKGIVGYCDDYQIITKENQLDFSVADRFFVVAQTTFVLSEYEIIKNNIKKLGQKLSKTVVFFDSICYTTSVRQREAEAIAKKSDFVIVVGDKGSSNTTKLANVASKFCKNVSLIENASEIKSLQIKKIENIGLLSGASAPKELVMEVIKVMSEDNTVEVIVDINEDNTVKAEEVPAAVEKKEALVKEESFSDMMKNYQPPTIRENSRLRTKVLSTDVNGISVAIEGLIKITKDKDGNLIETTTAVSKNDSGFISAAEVEVEDKENEKYPYNPDNYNVGDIIDAIVIPKENNDKNNKYINLSKKKFDEIKINDEFITKTVLTGAPFKFTFDQVSKKMDEEKKEEKISGLKGRKGTYTLFLPASHIKIGKVKPEEYLNKELTVRILPPKEPEDKTKKKRDNKTIYVSAKTILEEERARRDDDFWSSINVHDVIKGKVTRYAEFGIFVDLKHMEGLVKNEDWSWSWQRIKTMSKEDILALKEKTLPRNNFFEFVVLSMSRENKRVGLGFKQLQPHPIDVAKTKYPEGSIVTGKVTKILDFGAFVELEVGIEGLVHISKIVSGYRLEKVSDKLNIGDEVTVKVMSYDMEKERISLSIRDASEDNITKVSYSSVDETADKASATEGTSTVTTSRTRMMPRLEDQEDTRPDRKSRQKKSDREQAPVDNEGYDSGSSLPTIGDLFKDLKLVTDDSDDENPQD